MVEALQWAPRGCLDPPAAWDWEDSAGPQQRPLVGLGDNGEEEGSRSAGFGSPLSVPLSPAIQCGTQTSSSSSVRIL